MLRLLFALNCVEEGAADLVPTITRIAVAVVATDLLDLVASSAYDVARSRFRCLW